MLYLPLIPTHPFSHFASYSRTHYWDKFILISSHLIIILLDQNVQSEMLDMAHCLTLNER